MIAAHQSIDTFDAISNVTVGTRLFSIAPNFDFSTVVCECDLPTDCGWRLLTSAIVGSQRSKDVMEPDHASVQAEVFRVVTANPLHVKFFPTVTVFCVRGIRVGFFQRSDVSLVL